MCHYIVIINSQHISLHLIGVCYNTSHKVGRSTSHSREERGNRAARATLRCGERYSTFTHNLVYERLHRSSLKADNVAGDYIVQLVKLRIYSLASRLAILLIVCRQTQTYDVGRGQVGQLHPLGQGILPLLNPLGKHRLGQACGNHCAMHVGVEREVSLQAWHNLILHQMLHLEWHTRQRDDNCTVLCLEPHAWRCAVGIEKHRAAVGNHSL